MLLWFTDCSSAKKDVVFVIDSSWKPGKNQSWSHILSFVQSVVDKLSAVGRFVRVAVVSYTDTARLTTPLLSTERVRPEISSLKYDEDARSGQSNLTEALRVTLSRALDGVRVGAWRVVVVITEHLTTSPQLVAAVDAFKSSQTELIVVAVTGWGRVEIDTLRKISSETSRVDDYSRLIYKADEVVQYVCDGYHEIRPPSSPPPLATQGK